MPQLFSSNVLRDIYLAEEGERRNALAERRLRNQDIRSGETLALAKSSNALAWQKFENDAQMQEQKAIQQGFLTISTALDNVNKENYPTFVSWAKRFIGEDVFDQFEFPEQYDANKLAPLKSLADNLATGKKATISLTSPDGKQTVEAPIGGSIYKDLISKKWTYGKPTTKKGGRKIGDTRTIQKSGENVTEEWDGTKFVEVGRGPKFKPDADKQEKKAKMAQSLIDDLTPKLSSGTAAIVAGLAKDFDSTKAGEIRSEIPQELKPLYDKAIKLLEEYYGVEETPKPTTPSSPTKPTHRFIPGQGLVPIE